MPKKKAELKYEKVDRVSRWNYIQLIAKYILDSSVSNDELKDILLLMQTGKAVLILNVQDK
jgi:hypothetical protein